MFKEIILILFIQHSICRAASLGSDGYVNEPRCKEATVAGLRYYVVDENNSALYVECVAENRGIQQSCQEGTYFDVNLVSCMLPQDSSMIINGATVYQRNRKTRREISNESVEKTKDTFSVDSETFLNGNKMLVNVSVEMIPLQNATQVNCTPTDMTNNCTNQILNGTVEETSTVVVFKRDVNNLTANVENLINGLLCNMNQTDYPSENSNLSVEFKVNCTSNVTNAENSTMQSSLNMPNVVDNQNENSNVGRISIIDQLNNLTNLINSTLYDSNNETNSSNTTTVVTSTVNVKKRSVLNTFKSSSCSFCSNGVCNDYSNLIECICWTNFTGDSCQTPVDETSKIYTKILIGNVTIQDVISQNNQTNYALLWNGVVENLWTEISPEHAYIRNYNINLTGSLNEIGDSIQKLAVYSQLALDNFPNKMLALQNVLNKLAESSDEPIKQMAIDFLQSLAKFVEVEQTMMNDRSMKLSRDEILQTLTADGIKSDIEKELGSTALDAQKLLSSFKKSNLIDFVHSDETKKTIESIRNSTGESWNMVDDYGFMYFTYNIANVSGSYYEFTSEEKLNFYNFIMNSSQHDKRSVRIKILFLKKLTSNLIFKFQIIDN